MAHAGDRYAGGQQAAAPEGVHVKRSVTGTIKTGAGNSQFYSKHGITLHEINQDPQRMSLEQNPAPPPDYSGALVAQPPDNRGGVDGRGNSGEGKGGAVHKRSSSSSSTVSNRSIVIKRMSGLSDYGTKFPKLEECAHFHYDFIELGQIQVTFSDENQENIFTHGSDSSPPQPLFHLHITSRDKTWTVRRTYENLRGFDRQLHRCIFDRKFSQLPELRRNDLTEEGVPAMKKLLVIYLQRFSAIAGNMINCGPILSWMEMDNRGHRLIVSDDSAINTPAVGAAHVVKRYTAQAPDELSFEVGDMVSIIDMPPGGESAWWRGKKGFEVGFFPAECVEMIGEKLPQAMASKLPEPAKPVLRRRGKLISLLRNFFTSRPARTQLKRTGIVKERVFGCDLGEHLLNSERLIPLVLECCTSTIETHGLVDGIYRLSGVASNIQKLRNEFDEDKQPNLTDEIYLQDIHSISSLLKAYFRDLPNPLFTFQLYDKFIYAIQDEENKLMRIHDVIQQLPPPHYRTAKFLMEHLNRVAQHGHETGMHCKNLAIVWAPNLLRSKDLEMACTTAALQGVGIQAIVTEYLISHAELIFSDQLQNLGAGAEAGSLRRSRPKSLALSTPTKLLSLEEAQRMVNPSTSPKQKFIEVGGGPSNLPDKYHTVIELPGKKKSRKDRKSPVTGWRAIFTSKKGAEDYHGDDDEGMRSQRLRAVRSADSLLTEASRPTSSRNRYSDISDSSTFINPYTDEFTGVRPITGTSLERVKKSKATKRSASADNSYSESELEPVIDMSPLDEDELLRQSHAGDSPQSSLLTELEHMLHARSVDISSKNPPHLPSADTMGVMPATMPPQVTIRAKSASEVEPPQPVVAKRSKSTATTVESSAYDLPPLPPRTHGRKSDQLPVSSHQPTQQGETVRVMSPGKRKKAKAPLPPVAPPRKHAITENEEGNLEKTPQKPERKARSIEDLVTLQLTESPGARRKLLYSAPSELETQGTEGAPGELASYESNLTDDEAFNTQNLSLTTDSENEVERREGLSCMEGVQDGSTIGGSQDGMIHLPLSGDEGGQEGAAVEPALMTKGHLPPSLDSRPCHRSNPDIASQDGPDYMHSQTSSDSNGFDDAALMSKSLNSILTGAADTFYSSDEMAHHDGSTGGILYSDLIDSNSDSHVSGATMSTNFTSSSDLPCAASTSDESEATSAQVYAESLRAGSSNIVRRSIVPYSTSDSDTSYNRELPTPHVEPPPEYTFSASDTDTEVVRSPVDGYNDGMDSSDHATPNVDFSDSDAVFADPYTRQDSYAADNVSSDHIENLSALAQDSELSESTGNVPADLQGEPGVLVIRTPLDDRQEGVILQAASSRVKTPERQVASVPTSPEHPTGDCPELVTVDTQGVPSGAQFGDGYLADRSCSASPTFMAVQGRTGVQQAVLQDQNVDVSVGVSDDSCVKRDFDASLYGSQGSVQCGKDLKKSADSLLFEMDDLDTNQRDSARGSTDKLNMSSETDDVFFRPESTGNLRTETNMSISPENYLEDKSLQQPTENNQDLPPPKAEVTAEYQVRSAAALDRKKNGKELSRKKSVRELMSKFESSTPSESSDDGLKTSTAREPTDSGKCSSSIAQTQSKTPTQSENSTALSVSTEGFVPYADQQKTSPLLRKAGVEPRLHAESEVRSSDSPNKDSSMTELQIVESSRPGSSTSNLDPSDARSSDTDESSSSPRINDLRRRFEDREKRRSDQEHGPRLSSKDRLDSADSCIKVPSDNEQGKVVSERAQPSQHRSRPSLPFQQQGTSAKDTDEISALQAKSSSLGANKSTRSSLSERLQPLADRFRNFEESTGATSEGQKAESDLTGQRKSTGSSKGQFVQRYSHRDKAESPAVTGASASGNEPETQNSKPVISDPSAAEGVTSEVSTEPLSTSLYERRKKFESFGPADKIGGAETTKVTSNPGACVVAAPSSTQPDSSKELVINKARQFGSRSMVLQPNKAAPTMSKDSGDGASGESQDGTESCTKIDVKAATLPRESSCSKSSSDAKARRRKNQQSEDERPISVRDLSRQFERQLSEKSDTSRTSTGSLRGSGWNFAHDVANGNTPPVITTGDEVVASIGNKNVAQQQTQQQSWTTML